MKLVFVQNAWMCFLRKMCPYIFEMRICLRILGFGVIASTGHARQSNSRLFRRKLLAMTVKSKK